MNLHCLWIIPYLPLDSHDIRWHQFFRNAGESAEHFRGSMYKGALKKTRRSTLWHCIRMISCTCKHCMFWVVFFVAGVSSQRKGWMYHLNFWWFNRRCPHCFRLLIASGKTPTKTTQIKPLKIEHSVSTTWRPLTRMSPKWCFFLRTEGGNN